MLATRSSQTRVALFAAVSLAFAGSLWLFKLQAAVPVVGRTWQAVPDAIPAEGYAFNDTHGTVPGNPERTIADMHALFEKMAIYRKRHGRYPFPSSEPSLLGDSVRYPQEYGYADAHTAAQAFRNPDMRYDDSEHNSSNPESVLPFRQSPIRPDGTLLGSKKAPGTRDVLASTSMYFHRNARVFPNGKGTESPVGFYLVLWEDGQVEKVPHDQVRYVRPQKAPFDECFPGQAGTPPEGVYSYEDAKKHTLPMNSDGSNPNVDPKEVKRSAVHK